MGKACTTEQCRIEMLLKMYNTIEGTELLLDQIRIDAETQKITQTLDPTESPFKTLIATVLSARSRDETTIKVVNNLWQYYNTPESLANAPLDRLEELVHASGTFRVKAKNIKEIGRIIHEELHDQVPSDCEQLMKLPGVGRKVANCVLNFAFGKSVIPVDTHVHRISNRTGWVKTKTPEQTEKALEPLFPQKYWSIMNYTLVSYGKTICKPITPNCKICPVESTCGQLIEITKK